MCVFVQKIFRVMKTILTLEPETLKTIFGINVQMNDSAIMIQKYNTLEYHLKRKDIFSFIVSGVKGQFLSDGVMNFLINLCVSERVCEQNDYDKAE